MPSQQLERFLFLACLRVDCGEVVRRGQQIVVRARDLQRFLGISGGGDEHCRKHEVVRVLRIERQRFLRVSITLDQVAFGVPVDREISICERQRKLLHWLFHQLQTFLKLAVVNRHLAESMQRNCTRNSICRHVENHVERRSCLVPLACVVPVQLTEITKRSRIRGIHQVRFFVESLSSDIPFGNLSDQAIAQRRFNARTESSIKNRRGWNTANLFPELLQLLLSILCFFREQTFFFGDWLEQRDRSRIIARFYLLLRTLYRSVQRRLALFHFAFDDFLNVLNFELPPCVFDFLNRLAIRRGQHSDRHRRIADDRL